MGHYAFLDENNIVTEVIVGKDEDGINNWEEVYSEVRGQPCKKTSYNTLAGQHRFNGTPFRKNYAAIGYFYDESRDAFIPPKPYNSWVLNEDTCYWEAPIPSPEPTKKSGFIWNEESKSWEEVLGL